MTLLHIAIPLSIVLAFSCVFAIASVVVNNTMKVRDGRF